MSIKKEIGEKIKRLRKKRNYTQEKFAELIEITPRNVCNIEAGINFPRPETLERIIQVLNIKTEELFATDHIKTNEELLENINFYLNMIKNDNKMLEKIYKIIRDLLEDY